MLWQCPVALGHLMRQVRIFKLAVEACSINLAYRFDPMMAVFTSNIEPLPHQITAVYESIARQVQEYQPIETYSSLINIIQRGVE